MNNVDKIKALLDSPAVRSVYAKYINSSEIMTLYNFEKTLEALGDPRSIEVNFHEWPEIGEGDLVMTPDGEGVIFEVHEYTNNYRVEGDCWPIGPIRVFGKHQIALLSKAES